MSLAAAVISPDNALLLFCAGLIAGLVGTAGGITSLISYPALLAVGLPPLRANVTNIAAIVACWPGSAVASRPELIGQGQWLRRASSVSVIGGLLGSGLLLLTPPGVFTVVVPCLLVMAAVGLLIQPRLSGHIAKRAPRERRLTVSCALFAVSLYSGYFGAGAGIMLLALATYRRTEPRQSKHPKEHAGRTLNDRLRCAVRRSWARPMDRRRPLSSRIVHRGHDWTAACPTASEQCASLGGSPHRIRPRRPTLVLAPLSRRDGTG
jgi:hypothetical protein